MKAILIDTNVILDIALKREPFFSKSSAALCFLDNNKIKTCVSATTVTDIYYISRKAKNHDTAVNFLLNLLEIVDVATVDKGIIVKALLSEISDFEDAIQNFTALEMQCDTIITRNKTDFKNSALEILTPDEFLEQNVD